MSFIQSLELKSWCLLILLEEHQVVGYHVADVQVDDPVHKVETHEADGEHDARVLVDVAWSDSVQLVDVLPRVDEVLGRRPAGLFVGSPVHRVLEGAALRVGLWVVNLEPHLLEQRHGPTTYK